MQKTPLFLLLTTIFYTIISSACSVQSHDALKVLAGPFVKGQEVTKACLGCHKKEAGDFMKTIHWTWKEKAGDRETGKMNTVNNFYIAITSNEAACAQCHPGYGWEDKNFDFNNAENIDCLICHDTSGLYRKGVMAAGNPAKEVDLAAAAKSIGKPSRANCGSCHFFADGGDNVKSGNMGSALYHPSPEVDVHMGKLGFSCQSCHTTKKHAFNTSSDKAGCLNCHEPDLHENDILNKHTARVACQTCHIPSFSRAQATRVYQDWSMAGKKDADNKGIVKKDARGNLIYDYRHGGFVYQQNIAPTFAWWDGKFKKMIIGDTFKKPPVDLASPNGHIDDGKSKIFPFKVMRGKQPVDPVFKTMIIPHLFGGRSGNNPFWEKWDWEKAFEEGMTAAGLEYSGSHDWVETSMHMALNHEVAPKNMARDCTSCHDGGMDFKALGYEKDPRGN